MGRVHGVASAGQTIRRALDLGDLLVIDSIRPSPPATHVPGVVTFTRRPWGAMDTDGRAVALVLGSLGLAGCGSSVEGSITIDGQAAVIDRCESTSPSGFDGVDIVTDDDRFIRLLRDTRGDSIAQVAFFFAGRDRGPVLGDCAVGTIRSTSTTINNVTALDGEAKLNCDHSYTDQNMEAQRITIVGDVTFDNCH